MLQPGLGARVIVHFVRNEGPECVINSESETHLLVHLGSTLRTAAKPKPRAMREHFVVPSIGSSEVACAGWPNIRPFEHFLQLLNIVDDAFNVHSVSISDMSVAFVKRGGIGMSCLRERPAPSGNQHFLTSSAGSDSRGEPHEGDAFVCGTR